jgi:hypothetical protein
MRVGAFLALVALSGCGNGGPDISLPLVRDSAGIRVVEYAGPLPDREPFTLTDAPLVKLGEVNGPEALQFSRVVAAFGEADGTTVVADRLALEIRLFDEQGRHIRTVGGPGDGPGEFGLITWARRLRGDTIGVWDYARHRLSLFTADGDFVSSSAMGPIADPSPSSAGMVVIPDPQVIGGYEDGSMVADLVVAFVDVPEGVQRPVAPLVVVERETMAWHEVGTVEPGDWFSFPGSELFPVSLLPFGLRLRLAVAEDWMVVGWGDERGFGVMGRNGALETIFRPHLRRAPVQADEIERDRSRRLAAQSEDTRPELARVLDAIPYPAVKPAHGRIVASSEEIWIQEGDPETTPDSDRWFVFDREGNFLGSIQVPEGLRITDIGPDYVIGVRTDELDVPTVERFGLTRP